MNDKYAEAKVMWYIVSFIFITFGVGMVWGYWTGMAALGIAMNVAALLNSLEDAIKRRKDI